MKKTALTFVTLTAVLSLTACQSQKISLENEKAISQAATENKQASDAFFVNNAKQAGVKTTASGLQYQVIRAGTGAMVKSTDMVKIQYQAKLLNGEVVDATDEPAVVPVNQMIKGVAEGLTLTQVGGQYRFFVPANLAYENTGSVEDNTALIYDIAVLAINP